MHEGRIIAMGSPEELRAAHGAWRVTIVGAAPPPTSLAQFSWSRSGGGWSAPIEDVNAEVGRLAAALSEIARPFSMAPPSLATVFEAMTGSPLQQDVHRESSNQPIEARP
jgi:AraC-like DNA-binding protein